MSSNQFFFSKLRILWVRKAEQTACTLLWKMYGAFYLSAISWTLGLTSIQKSKYSVVSGTDPWVVCAFSRHAHIEFFTAQYFHLSSLKFQSMYIWVIVRNMLLHHTGSESWKRKKSCQQSNRDRVLLIVMFLSGPSMLHDTVGNKYFHCY